MLGGVVGGAVVPAAPDDVVHARAVMRTASRWSLPRARALSQMATARGLAWWESGGEVAQGAAELAVDRPPEALGDAGCQTGG